MSFKKSFSGRQQLNQKLIFLKNQSNDNLHHGNIRHRFLHRNQPKFGNKKSTGIIQPIQSYRSLKNLHQINSPVTTKCSFLQNETPKSIKRQSPLKFKTSKSKQTVKRKYNKILTETTSTCSAETWKLNNTSTPSFLKVKKTLIVQNNNKIKFELADFIIIRKIGSGKFGKVFMARQKRTKFILALKVIQKKTIIQQGVQQFIQQLKIQSFLNHPNIIGIYGFFDDQKYFYVMMQLGSDGHLFNFLQKHKKISQQGTSIIIRSLLKAVNYFHSYNIIHRDIKPENIVITAGTIKLCDFGWACRKDNYCLRSTFCGTPLYLSPELLRNEGYNQKADLWAIGILAYQLLVGHDPFCIKNKSEMYKIVTQQVNYPQNMVVSQCFKQFIGVILNKNPAKRQSCLKLLSLQFIKVYSQLDTCQQFCK